MNEGNSVGESDSRYKGLGFKRVAGKAASLAITPSLES